MSTRSRRVSGVQFRVQINDVDGFRELSHVQHATGRTLPHSARRAPLGVAVIDLVGADGWRAAWAKGPRRTASISADIADGLWMCVRIDIADLAALGQVFPAPRTHGAFATLARGGLPCRAHRMSPHSR